MTGAHLALHPIAECCHLANLMACFQSHWLRSSLV